MTRTEKLKKLKSLLGITDSSQDAQLENYLELAREEIFSCMYSMQERIPNEPVPAKYEPTQIMACVVGYNMNGAEGQTGHSENSVARQFAYSDMLDYIRSRVVPHVGVVKLGIF